MKRYFALFVMLAVLLIPALGISAQEDEHPLRATDPFWNPTPELLEQWRVIDDVEEGAQITFWTMSLSPTFNEYIEKIVENFQATYPEVTVTWEDQPWDTLQDKYRNAVASGDAPDVVNLNPAWVVEFAEAGSVLNIDELLADYPGIRDEYSQGAWLTYSIDGETSYQVPWYLGLSNFLAYNTDILAELGMTEEDLPTTWLELYDFAQTVRENSDYYGTSLNFGTLNERNVMQYLIYNDVAIWNEDGTQVAFNTPEASEQFQIWADLLANDYIPAESVTDDHRAMIDRFAAGETAIVLVAPHMLRLVEEANPDLNYAVVPGVSGTSGANPTDVQSLVVTGSTEFPRASLALALFVTNAETQAAFAKEVGIYPSNLESYNDPFFQTVDEENPGSMIRPLAQGYVEGADNRPTVFPNAAEAEQVILEEQTAALLGEKSTQEALDSMAARLNELIAAAATE